MRFEAGRAVPVFPEIRNGVAIDALDFTRVGLPGEGDRTVEVGAPGPHGAEVTVSGEHLHAFVHPWIQIRDACARLAVTSVDPHVFPGVVLRCQSVDRPKDRFHVQLCFELWPERRCTRLSLELSGVRGQRQVLADWTPCPVSGPQHRTTLELRAQGATLTGAVNQHDVVVAHSPALGIGGVGLSLRTTGPRGRVWLHGLEIHKVGT